MEKKINNHQNKKDYRKDLFHWESVNQKQKDEKKMNKIIRQIEREISSEDKTNGTRK